MFMLFNSGLPWHRTLSLAFANMGRNIVTRKTCCGNHGQPGC